MTMTTTPMLQKLVRDGRVTPYDAALLMELRSRVAAERDRVKFREHPFLAIVAVIGRLLTDLDARRSRPSPAAASPHRTS